ncbi:hypothetical protein OAV88_00225 [bacterium]|nr:hypothetical protein [bacterium]
MYVPYQSNRGPIDPQEVATFHIFFEFELRERERERERKKMSRDKMHLTQTEWKYLYGGKVDMKERRKVRLDFDVCALSLRPWADPVTTQEGKFVFDLLSLVPYVKKNKKHPITGKQLELKDLKKLTYHKNREGKYHCPVTMKVRGV